MRVGLDVSPLHRPHPPGVVRVATEITAELERRGEIEVVRLMPPDDVSLRRWRQSILPGEVRARDLVGLHSFVSAFAWRGSGVRVHTIHELPWRHGTRENADWPHRFWARVGPWRADAVVVPTHFVARDLARRLAGEGGKVHVVPWGVSERFAEEPAAGAVDEPLLARYRLTEGPFALCLGAVREKKNLAAVLAGLAHLRGRGGPDLTLVVTGEHTAQLRRDLGLASRLGLNRWVSTPGEIEDEDLPALLRLASVVPVLSRSEGFGLPALEALACGTPVVVAHASAQAEVAGEHGIAVDPDSPESVADGLERALRGREELRYVLPARARELSWSAAATAIEEVWKALA